MDQLDYRTSYTISLSNIPQVQQYDGIAALKIP